MQKSFITDKELRDKLDRLPEQDSKGRIFVVSSASGGGKSSLIGEIVKNNPQTRLSISLTTRSPRPSEIPGQDYHFVTPQEFRNRKHEFLESVSTYDKHYATLKSSVDDMLEKGLQPILDVTYKGLKAVKKAYPDYTITSIYIWPPSKEVLLGRLRQRDKDSITTYQLKKRTEGAVEIILTESPHYEYWILNNNFHEALANFQDIVDNHGRAVCLRQESQSMVKELFLL